MKSDVLDPIDFQIVNVLMRNGRASYTAIGKTVGLSAHAAADRIRRLRRSGALIGFTAVVDRAHLGRSLDAFIDVRLLASTPSDTFEAFALALPAVCEIAFVTGRFDYHVRVSCFGADDLDATVRAIRQEGGAAATETRIVLRSARTPAVV